MQKLALEGPPPALIVMAGESSGRAYSLRRVTLIGRDGGADIRLSFDDVLPLHARIRRRPNGVYELATLGLGGIRVNGVNVARAELQDGDRVEVGRSAVLLFARADDVVDRAVAIQRSDALGRFAGGIAHEFNNLLGAVSSNLAYVRNVADSHADDVAAQIGPAVEDAEEAIRRAAKLTTRLVGLAEQSFAVRRIDVRRLVHGVASRMAADARTDVQIAVEVPNGDIVIAGDASALGRALTDLCANACDAMPNGGRLTLITRLVDDDSHVRIDVRDTGSGMDSSVRSKAFEPSFTTKPGRGTGLGLALVDRVIRAHGGRVSLVSQPGSGTVVSVRLPRWVSDNSAPQVSEAMALEPVVMLVDDDAPFRRGAERWLRGLGFNVWVASDGATAIRRFGTNPDAVSLVILNSRMGDISAEDIVRQLTAIRPDVRVVLLAGLPEDASISLQLQKSASRVLEKTVGTESLQRGILEAIGADD